jgi:protocatechuate 3,4-dioxygenase beta subunit
MRPVLVLLLVLGAVASLYFAVDSIFAGGPRGEQIITGPAVATPGGGTPDVVQPAPLADVGDIQGVPASTERTEVEQAIVADFAVGKWANTLSGTVTDPDGQGVYEAKVWLMTGNRHQLAVLREIMTGTEAESSGIVLTDEAGHFEFQGVDPGKTYTLLVKHEDYSRLEVPDVRIPSEGEHVIDVQLETGYMLSGYVTDQYSGQAIESAELRLEDPMFAILSQAQQQKIPNAVTVYTDETGFFVFRNVNPGNRNLICKADGYGTRIKNNLYFQGEEELEKEQNFELGEALEIRGYVFGPDRAPIKDASFTAIGYSSDLSSKGSGTSNADGQFTIGSLAEGAYALIIRAKGFEDRREQRIEAGDHGVEIEMAAQGGVLGSVVDGKTGKPLKSFLVDVRLVQGGKTYGRSVKRQNFRNVKEGRFQLSGISKGTYAVQVAAQGYATTFSEMFEIQQGMTTPDVTVNMTQGGTLTGRVVDAYTGEPVVGAVVTTAENNWVDSPFTSLLGAMVPRTTTDSKATSGKDGAFTMKRMTPETYQIQIRHPEYTTVIMNDVTITEGHPTDLGTLKQSHGGSISGTVYGPGGSPLGNASVSLNDPAQMGRARQVRTGANGRFEFTGVAEGTYKLSASRPPSSKGSPFDVIVDMKNSELEVTILDGREYSQDLYLSSR